MQNWIITGIAAGIAAAAMQGTAMTPSLISIVIFYLSPLPLFLVGFSRGATPVALGVAVMALVLVLLSGSIMFALMAVLSAGLAPLAATHLSMITRTASATTDPQAGEGEARDAGREWYPEGRLVLWLAAIAAIVAGLSVLIMGTDFAAYKKFVSDFVTPALEVFEKRMPDNQPPFPKEQFVTMMVFSLPFIAAAMWLLATISSMRIAISALSASNKTLRPWPPFSQLAFPPNSVIILAVALIASYFLSGIPQLLALGALGAFAVAFTILGLAVIHSFVGKSPARPFLLAMLYTGLVLFGGIFVVPIVILGLLDLNFNFRKSHTI